MEELACRNEIVATSLSAIQSRMKTPFSFQFHFLTMLTIVTFNSTRYIVLRNV